MPDIRVRIQGGDELRRALGNEEFVRGPLRNFLNRAAFVVEAEMKQAAPVDTGRLRTSITTNVEQLRATIGPTVHYAPYVEFGTRPHWPPPGALQPWASRHGFPAGAKGDAIVRWIISRRGTKAHPFLRPAAQKAKLQIEALGQMLLQEIALRFSRRA